MTNEERFKKDLERVSESQYDGPDSTTEPATKEVRGLAQDLFDRISKFARYHSMYLDGPDAIGMLFTTENQEFHFLSQVADIGVQIKTISYCSFETAEAAETYFLDKVPDCESCTGGMREVFHGQHDI